MENVLNNALTTVFINLIKLARIIFNNWKNSLKLILVKYEKKNFFFLKLILNFLFFYLAINYLTEEMIESRFVSSFDPKIVSITDF